MSLASHPLTLENAVLQLIGESKQCAPHPVTNERQLWWHLAACTLSGRVPYSTAVAAADRLIAEGFPWSDDNPDMSRLLRQISHTLCEPFDLGSSTVRYRFPHTRAAWLTATVSHVRDQHGQLRILVESFSKPEDLRAYLVSDIQGFGPKQSSMFLRDTGLTDSMAIIDAHVLRFMNIVCGLAVAPHQLSRLPAYERYEANLWAYVHRWNVPMSVVDRAIWAVMRTALQLRLL